MMKERLMLIWLILGLAVFGYFNLQITKHTPSEAALSTLPAAAWLVGLLLCLFEVTLSMKRQEKETSFWHAFNLATALAIAALVWLAVTSLGAAVLMNLIVGAALYVVLVRLPFKSLLFAND